MSFYDNRCYYFNKLFLSIIGQWPYRSRLQSYVIFIVTFLSYCSLTVFQFWGVIRGISDASIVMENMSLILMNSLCLVKLINYLCNKYKMKLLLDDIEETWKTTQADQEIEILRNYGEQSRMLTIGYALPFYMVWIFFTIMPHVISGIYMLLPTNRTYTVKFLYRCEHIFDMDKYYNLLTLHGIVSVFLIVSIPIAVDGLFIAFIQHACALFEIVRYNTERVRSSDSITLQSNVMDDKAYHTIIDCVKLHKHVLKLVSTSSLNTHYAIWKQL